MCSPNARLSAVASVLDGLWNPAVLAARTRVGGRAGLGCCGRTIARKTGGPNMEEAICGCRPQSTAVPAPPDPFRSSTGRQHGKQLLYLSTYI